MIHHTRREDAVKTYKLFAMALFFISTANAQSQNAVASEKAAAYYAQAEGNRHMDFAKISPLCLNKRLALVEMQKLKLGEVFRIL